MISRLQQRYGTFDPGRDQTVRQPFWSFVKYPQAGASSLTFFGNSIGSTGNLQLTNLPRQNDLGLQHLQIKCLRTAYFIASQDVLNFDGTDASTLYSDLINGIFQCGVLVVKMGQREELIMTKPFLNCPPADGRLSVKSAGLTALTLVEGAPNTFGSSVSAPPHGDLITRKENAYIIAPDIVLEPGQSFQVNINFPSGTLPVIADGVIDDDTNPLYVGVIFDGIIWRPVQ